MISRHTPKSELNPKYGLLVGLDGNDGSVLVVFKLCELYATSVVDTL